MLSYDREGRQARPAFTRDHAHLGKNWTRSLYGGMFILPKGQHNQPLTEAPGESVGTTCLVANYLVYAFILECVKPGAVPFGGMGREWGKVPSAVLAIFDIFFRPMYRKGLFRPLLASKTLLF